MAWLSLRAYAKHRGCALSAVQRAIESGRLAASVARDGRGHPKITDAAAADAEWKATTRAEHVPISVAPAARPPPAGRAGDEHEAPLPDPNELAEARARLDLARAELAELDLAERRRELLPAKDVEAQLVNAFTSCKTKLLGIPSRARQQDPALTVPQIALFETLIREALEGLAAGGDEGGEAAAA